MSLQSAKEFTVAAATDPALAAKVNGAVSGKRGDQAAASYAAVGKSCGYDFTAAEAAEVRASFLEASQLSEGDLDKVAGGFGPASSGGNFASGPGCTEIMPGRITNWGDLFPVGPISQGPSSGGSAPLGSDPRTWSPTPIDTPARTAGNFFSSW